MKFVTREKPKVDRVACPWLIKKFIDPNAELLFVPADEVLQAAVFGNAPQIPITPQWKLIGDGKVAFRYLQLYVYRLAQYGFDVSQFQFF